MLTPILIALVVGYLLGSLPFGYLVARSKGVNIFEVGSKNPGATNVRRVLGKGPGNLVFVLDAMKGALATGWAVVYFRFFGSERNPGVEAGSGAAPDWLSWIAIAGLVGALVGHSFSCFTRFRGGKGVATASGALLVLIPVSVLIGAVVWIVTFYTSRYVSLASILAAVALPISVFLLGGRSVMLGVAVAISVFVVLRHRTNIQRLMKGTENKFVKKAAAASPKS